MMPARVKAGFAAAISFLFFIAVPPAADIEYNSLIGFTLLCASELLIGVVLAFATNVFFAINYIAGQLIDMQIGFGIVNVYDIQNNTQIPMVGNLTNLVMLIVFFSVNGHHRLIQIVHMTLTKLPVGNLVLRPEIGLVALEVFAMTFTLAIMVALPVIASGLIVEIAFGALIRTVPQINMFVVGIPVKLFIGFIIMVVMIPVFVSFSGRIFDEMFMGIEKMFAALMIQS
jgi:flagellar biosynthetic protein FliR